MSRLLNIKSEEFKKYICISDVGSMHLRGFYHESQLFDTTSSLISEGESLPINGVSSTVRDELINEKKWPIVRKH